MLLLISLFLCLCRCSEQAEGIRFDELCNIEEFDRYPTSGFMEFLRKAILDEGSEPAYRVLCFAIGTQNDHLMKASLEFIHEWIIWKQAKDSASRYDEHQGFVMSIDLQMTTLLMASSMANRRRVCMEILACPSYVVFVADNEFQDPEMRLLLNCRVDGRSEVVGGLLTQIGESLSDDVLEKCLKLLFHESDPKLIHMLFVMTPQLRLLSSGNTAMALEKYMLAGHTSIARMIALFHKYLLIRAVVRDCIGIDDLVPAIWGPTGTTYFQK